VFGGSAAVIPAQPSAGQSSAGGSGATGAAGAAGAAGSASTPALCADVPQGSVALLDDFDDGDSLAAPAAEREAYWYTIKDSSPGTLEPDGQFLPVPGGVAGSLAAHLEASGFSEWGAALMANISHLTSVRCPYNASRFAGLRFKAKGQGRVRAQFGVPDVIDKEFGGNCDPDQGHVCYDLHGKLITLSSDAYQTFELAWSDFQQRNFGRQVDFDPAAVSFLQLAFETPDLPVQLWLDDVEFWDGTPAPIDPVGGAGGSAGEPAAAGAAGEAGMTGSGGQGGSDP
jgi:hypothetical protein